MRTEKPTACSCNPTNEHSYRLQRFAVALSLGAALFLGSCTKIDMKKDAAASAASKSDAVVPRAGKPNIVLIMAEDMGYEIPTANGGESYSTPTMDRLAAGGMRFTQCHGSAMCAPSRWMLMTGKYSFRNYFYYGIMYTDQRTFANVLQDAGYRTGVYGKWALDGGDTSIHTFGFQDYLIWNPFKDNSIGGLSLKEEDEAKAKGNIYMNTNLYDDSAFLPQEATMGKFTDDILTDSVIGFIKANKNNPFFVYYPMILSHIPAQPTPDQPEYATWDPSLKIDDTSYFKNQVTYTDKKIGQILDSVESLGLANETVFIVLFGDNGTREDIISNWNGTQVAGSRMEPTEHGTHVSLFIYWPGTVRPRTVNAQLISFTDFMPTLADIAGTTIPASYGQIDGVSFYPNLLGQKGTPRQWLYNMYWPVPNRPGLSVKTFYEWVQNRDYKLYDTTSVMFRNELYQFENMTEKQPALNPDSLSAPAAAAKSRFLKVLNAIHKDPEYRSPFMPH